MPVIRKRVEVASTVGQGGAVQRPQSAMTPAQPSELRVSNVAGLANQTAGHMARMAGEYSRAMALAAQDEGMALAKAAVFNMDEMGMPQMPEEIKHRMGSIAARAYTGAIEERYAHQMTTAIRAQIQDAQSANLYDMDAFIDDAQYRIDKMREVVPEHMQGAFQQISTGLLADGGAAIGRRQGQLAVQHAQERAPMTVDDAVQTIQDNIITGYDDRATMLVEQTFEMIDAFGPEIMSPAQKRAAKQNVLVSAGVERMKRDLNLNDPETSAATISALIYDLNDGTNEDLLEYFTFEGFAENKREMAAAAAGQLNFMLGEANRRGSARRQQAEDQAELGLIFQGATKSSEKNKSLMDQGLSASLKIAREDGNGYRPINLYDWVSMDGDTRSGMVALMKDAGYTSETVDQFFRVAMRGDDPGIYAAGFELYRDLREGVNSRGENGADLTADLPQKVREVYGLAEMLHGSGNVGQEAIGQAFQTWDNLKSDPWTDERWAEQLNADLRTGGNFFWRRGGSRTTADNWQRDLDGVLDDKLFRGVAPSAAERKEAREVFQTYYEAGQGLIDFDEAVEMTRQSMDGRFVDSEYMNQRSSMAPEIHYPTPPSNGLVDALLQGDRAMNEMLFNLLGIRKGMGPEALTRARVNTFDVVAHGLIEDLVENHDDPLVQEIFPQRNELYIGGRDYILKPITRGGGPPQYEVMMRTADGPVRSLGVIDPREAYEGLTLADRSYRARQEAVLSRKGQMLTDKFGAAGIDAHIAQELVKDPTRDPWDIIEEFWGESMDEQWEQDGGR